MSRTKKKVVVVHDEAEAQEALKTFATASSQLKQLEGTIEQEVAKVREKHARRVNELNQTKAESFEKVQAYAEGKKELLFTKTKSLEWLHGRIGFRQGTPKTDKPKGITWDAMLKLLKENNFTNLIRTKEEIDKEKIIASREDESLMGKLAKIGLVVIQDETFFVEPKVEELAEV